MSELKTKIRSDMTVAMKERDKERVGALRMLLAAIQLEETNGSKHEITDDDVLKVIAREIKKRRESAEVYAEAGRQELADNELAEARILSEYQPAQLDDEQLGELVAAAIAEVKEQQGEATMKQMGQVMKVATARAAGRADGKRLSAAVRELLQ
ncbi:GatB/YqeY domain-containing protein [Corynebacterium sp. sy017]|uniref:GatB/YqeY domain-containing protein n=1 Tax=unclassified Corynebacterium TaxID=2624378 RepID=UPI00118609A4|nr:MULTISPECIES: GatB/YqeY domain-containing protein [unclassified Corynebacterium]MBP3089412.1 GatB/YqeY domain-containing protein [Corynebacterium sp. sy017]QDZ43337.1 GatB/YqeY domain-containing protein [Corynebacterium sp. sy039]TSD90901.1 GatB/YqeY domain-containing protein [Corynebacterium sp. SY003]